MTWHHTNSIPHHSRSHGDVEKIRNKELSKLPLLIIAPNVH